MVARLSARAGTVPARERAARSRGRFAVVVQEAQMSRTTTPAAQTRRRALVHQLRRPRLQLVLKASLAAALAWQIGSAVPGSLSEYADYAPLGAISVIYPAVTDSVREAARAVVAIGLGIAVAVAIQWVAWPNALTVGLVVAAGTASVGGAGWQAGELAARPSGARPGRGGAESAGYAAGLRRGVIGLGPGSAWWSTRACCRCTPVLRIDARASVGSAGAR